MEDRPVHQRNRFLEQIHAGALGGVEHSRQSCVRWLAAFRAKAAHDFAVPGLLAFDYGARTIRFGDADEAEAKQILAEIRQRFPQYRPRARRPDEI